MDKMNKRAYFYNPHIEFRGARVILPQSIKIIANEANGKVLDLNEVVKKIKNAASDFGGEVGVFPEVITLSFKERDRLHSFCVIKYREKK